MNYNLSFKDKEGSTSWSHYTVSQGKDRMYDTVGYRKGYVSCHVTAGHYQQLSKSNFKDHQGRKEINLLSPQNIKWVS